MKHQLQFRVNGSTAILRCDSRDTLLNILRDGLGLTGTKDSCSAGSCGACNVLLNGDLVSACLVLAVEAQGGNIETIEGITADDRVQSVQNRLVESGAVQCGACMPGMVMSIKALLDATDSPSSAQVREALSGNLCRCTGYDVIVEAVKAAGVSQ